ncbi:MAG: polyphenol oxidase family protein [Candidatus Methylacidiphilales bacterium]|nr:polyphenol oxidase family protein [Candidatus Methylacidiphilales bacterium]
MDWMTFPALELDGLRHGFSLRTADIAREDLDAQLRPSLTALGLPAANVVEGEQTHGNSVAFVPQFPLPGAPESLTPAGRIPGVDALVTQLTGVPLVVRVADCGPVYFYDPVHRAIAVAHSGRKGTEGNITAQTIRTMQEKCGTRPEDLIVQLGPCIRPPHYEVPFAEEIGKQARAAGVVRYHDSLECTACDLEKYYSYRAELGKTGRMWAVLMLEG